MRVAGRRRAIVLVDGEHHPAAVGDALSDIAVDDDIVAVAFMGGAEKVAPSVLLDPEAHYGFPFVFGEPNDPASALQKAIEGSRSEVVIDLSDEPVVRADEKIRLAAVASAYGLPYETPGMSIEPPQFTEADFAGPVISVIGTAKRTGKTAVCGHLASLIAGAGGEPAIVSMGRGGPSVPQVAGPPIGLERLIDLARHGVHAASDYLEDAVLANVPTVGCRRVGGGPSGRTGPTNFVDGVRLAAELPGVETLLLEGSGASIPPVRADRTICIVGNADQAGRLGGPLRLLIADLVLTPADPMTEATARRWAKGRVETFEMIPTPVVRPPDDAKVAIFTTAATAVEGVDPVLASTSLADRNKLAEELAEAEAAGCTHFLTELKAAAIDTVAEFAVARGIEVGFIRNRPISADADLDELLLDTWRGAADG